MNITRAENFQRVYANHAEASFSSPFDFNIVVARFVGSTGIEAQAEITLPPAVAKDLFHRLAKQVTDYEQQFGTIAIPQLQTEPEPEPEAASAAAS